MTNKVVKGIYAAVLASRDLKGEIDENALAHQLEFLLAHAIRNFAFNGATGEYCLTSQHDLKRCLAVAKSTLPADSHFLCGVGAAGFQDTLTLGKVGMEAGADGLLLPMPHFFPYAQDDLSAFVREVASELPAPILLYNLPQFTSGLEIATITSLFQECRNVIGIKDSSGSLEILRKLTTAGIDSSRIVGNDRALAKALTEGVCDGVVSGVACVLPEVFPALFSNGPASIAFKTAAARLNEFIEKIQVLPVPWGLKAIAEARGIARASYQQPVSERRVKQIDEIQTWFAGWIDGIAEQ